jgi:hypothetical protein
MTGRLTRYATMQPLPATSRTHLYKGALPELTALLALHEGATRGDVVHSRSMIVPR